MMNYAKIQILEQPADIWLNFEQLMYVKMTLWMHFITDI